MTKSSFPINCTDPRILHRQVIANRCVKDQSSLHGCHKRVSSDLFSRQSHLTEERRLSYVLQSTKAQTYREKSLPKKVSAKVARSSRLQIIAKDFYPERDVLFLTNHVQQHKLFFSPDFSGLSTAVFHYLPFSLMMHRCIYSSITIDIVVDEDRSTGHMESPEISTLTVEQVEEATSLFKPNPP